MRLRVCEGSKRCTVSKARGVRMRPLGCVRGARDVSKARGV